MSEEPKAVWAWAVALLIGIPLLYVASFGPACWLADREIIPSVEFYRPLAQIVAKSPGPVRDAYCWYAGCGPDMRETAGYAMIAQEWKKIRVAVASRR